MKGPDVLCIGQIVADIIAQPLEGFRFEEDTTRVKSITLTNGGDAFNTAVDLVRLGIKTALAGRVGADPLGRLLVGRAEEAGIDAEGVRISPDDPTSACVVLVNREGERVFIYCGGANESLCCSDLDMNLVRGSRIVHLGGIFDMPGIEGDCLLAVLRAAKKAGRKTSMDVTWDNGGKWLSRIRDSLDLVDYFLPSMNEVREMLGVSDPETAAAELLSMGVTSVVIKLGSEGCYFANHCDSGFLAPAPVDRVADTTGAGDAFVAGFLAAQIRGWSFRDCAEFGNAVGALAVRAVGATAGVTSFEEAVLLMQAGRSGGKRW